MAKHTVKQGECLSSIAQEYGFTDWRNIYDHPENTEFRQRRPDPHVICPNDRLFIPDREEKEEVGATEQHHKFRRHQVTSLLRLILKDEQRRVWAKLSYKLIVGDRQFEGITDDQGLIEHEIPTDTERPELTVWLPPRKGDGAKEIRRMDYMDQEDPAGADRSSTGRPVQESTSPSQPGDTGRGEEPAERKPFTWTLVIGHLDPVEEISGVQARLHNLGFDPGPIDGIKGSLTGAAVKRFQETFGLAVDGIAGPRTQAKLKEEHGC